MKTEKPFTPFPSVGYFGPAYFCDREIETKSLINNIRGGQSTTLVAIRRIGKTGLIKHLQFNLKEEYTCIYADILPTENSVDFLNTLASAILNSVPEKTGLGAKIWNFIKSLRPVITFDSLSGEPNVSFNIQARESEHQIESLFAFLEQQEKKVIFAIDEFQQILDYPEKNMEAWLRTLIQQLKNVVFIFSGSQPHLMNEMFANPSKPFFRSTLFLQLEKINFESYQKFIIQKFAEHKKEISSLVVAQMLPAIKMNIMKQLILLFALFLFTLLNVNGQDIFQFIKNNEIDSVKSLLEKKIGLEQEYNGKTPMMVAIESDSKVIIDLLLENGVDINKKSGRGYPPLMYALKKDNTELSKYLISKGADINIKDNEGNGCIFYALKSGNYEMIEFLNERGAQIPNIGNVTDGPHIKILSDTLYEVFYFNHDSSANQTMISNEKLNADDFKTFQSEFLKCEVDYPAKGNDKTVYADVKKIVAIGDIHGEYNSLMNLLRNNQIIDSNLDWNFGTGHIVFIGDVFDRGEMVTESLWLIYKLEKQADKVGGKVHFILGNHELINLVDEMGSSDIADKYNVLCYNLDYNYSDLYKSSYVLGDWLRKQRTFIKINDFLFAHGGIPVEIVNKQVTLYNLNQAMQKFLCSPIQSLENIEENVRLAGMSMEYRGYFDAGADYYKELIEGLPKTLDFYDVNYIVVGHTTVDKIAMIKDNKVIAIDVPLGDNEINGQALLIQNDELYVLNYDGTKEKLK